MIIREANVSDAVAISKVHVESWRATYPGIVPQEFLDSLSADRRVSDWRRMLSDTSRPWCYYVAETESGEIIGFAGGGLERTGNRTYTGELGAIYLLEAWQRRGIGRQLAAVIADRLLREGHVSMIVWVLADNPFRAFYEALGGEPAGGKQLALGGADLQEVAYGWKDITGLAALFDPGFSPD